MSRRAVGPGPSTSQGLREKDEVAGTCKACATAFGVREEVEASGIPLLTQYKGQQSLRERLIQGYQVVTF